MRTIEDHSIRFGELAGPLLHGTRFFDYQLISTQVLTELAGHPFEDIVEAGGIPYAPVDLRSSVHRYPTFQDELTVEVVSTRVGDSSLRLVYEVIDDDERAVSSTVMTHVTIAPEGGALPIPESARETYRNLQGERNLDVGPTDQWPEGDELPSFEKSVTIRSPHLECSELAYFEKYPRVAAIAFEEFLESRGTSLSKLAGEKQPFRLRDWRWEFQSPVPFESTLHVECDVRAIEPYTLRVAHTFSTDGVVRIRGRTDYGCFDREGSPVSFDDAMLAPLRGSVNRAAKSRR